MAEMYAPTVLPALGVHPHDAEKANEDALALIRRLAVSGKIAAIGETGLDFFRYLASAPTQIWNLERHCEIAADTGLPIILHCRNAYAPLLEVLKKFPGLKAIQHSFSGTRADLEGLLQAGALVSFSAMVTYPRNEELRWCATEIPEGRLLFETDAPYLPPHGRRGERNEPANVSEVYKTVAQLRGVRVEALSAVVADNFTRFIGWDPLRPFRRRQQEGLLI